MAWEVVYCFAGSLLGFLLGLIPSMHINNFLPIFLLMAAKFGMLADSFVVFVVAASSSFLISSFLPSYFLGAINEENFISILPSNKMLLRGEGYKALQITLAACLLSILFSFLLIGLFLKFYSQIYFAIRKYVWLILIYVLIFDVWIQKRKLEALLIIILSSFLGIIGLNYPYLDGQKVLFPILIGLFSLPNLFLSIKQKVKIPHQKTNQKFDLDKSFIKQSFFGSIGGIVAGFLPAVGTSQIAIALQRIVGGSSLAFLAIVGSITMANEIFSLVSLYLVGNPRSGSAVAIQSYSTNMNFHQFLLTLPTITFSATTSFLLADKLAKKFAKFVSSINYSKISLATFIFIVCLVFLLTGIHGLLLAMTSFFIGLATLFLGVKRSTNTAVLITPSIFFFLGLTPAVYELLGI